MEAAALVNLRAHKDNYMARKGGSRRGCRTCGNAGIILLAEKGPFKVWLRGKLLAWERSRLIGNNAEL